LDIIRFYYIQGPLAIKQFSNKQRPSSDKQQEAQLMLKNLPDAYIELSQGHQTWYHSIC